MVSIVSIIAVIASIIAAVTAVISIVNAIYQTRVSRDMQRQYEEAKRSYLARKARRDT